MQQLDEFVNKVERVLILVCVAGMTLLVGADVIQRTFSRPVGKTAQLLAWLGDKVAGPLSPEARASLEGPVGDVVFALFCLAFFVLAAHASRQVNSERTGAPPPRIAGSAARGLVALALTSAAVKALLWAFPSSVPGAQKFALGLMLWAGMLGASVATRERRHILLDAVTKKLGDGDKKLFALLGGLATGLFCFAVAALAGIQLAGEIHEWSSHEGVGLYESLPIPTWIATLSIPTSFFLMGSRFLGYGVRDFLLGPPVGGDGGHGVDLEELKQQTVDVASQVEEVKG